MLVVLDTSGVKELFDDVDCWRVEDFGNSNMLVIYRNRDLDSKLGIFKTWAYVREVK